MTTSVQVVGRALPVPQSDASTRAERVSAYGDNYVAHTAPTRHHFADEGSYLVATNPTIGTGFTWVAAQTAFADVNPNFVIQNTDPYKSVFLDFVKLIATAVGTSATSWNYAVELDTIRLATTQHMTAVVPVNPNMGKPSIQNVTVMAQNSATATVIPLLSGAGRVVARGVLGGLNIAGDEFLITFGSTDAGAYPGTADTASQPGRRVSSAVPVIIGPQQSCTLYFWAPSSSASINPEFEIGMWAR